MLLYNAFHYSVKNKIHQELQKTFKPALLTCMRQNSSDKRPCVCLTASVYYKISQNLHQSAAPYEWTDCKEACDWWLVRLAVTRVSPSFTFVQTFTSGSARINIISILQGIDKYTKYM